MLKYLFSGKDLKRIEMEFGSLLYQLGRSESDFAEGALKGMQMCTKYLPENIDKSSVLYNSIESCIHRLKIDINGHRRKGRFGEAHGARLILLYLESMGYGSPSAKALQGSLRNHIDQLLFKSKRYFTSESTGRNDPSSLASSQNELDPVEELEILLNNIFGSGAFDANKVASGFYGLVEEFSCYCEDQGEVAVEYVREYAQQTAKKVESVKAVNAELGCSMAIFVHFLFAVSLQDVSPKHKEVVDTLNAILNHYESLPSD